tara:strand:+ start:1354 stop:1512 length:159 start_codon:yes stop_codon:yes gene_type:complete
MTEQDKMNLQFKRQHAEYTKRIQEARERGDRVTEAQLQQELNYMDDASYKRP